MVRSLQPFEWVILVDDSRMINRWCRTANKYQDLLNRPLRLNFRGAPDHIRLWVTESNESSGHLRCWGVCWLILHSAPDKSKLDRFSLEVYFFQGERAAVQLPSPMEVDAIALNILSSSGNTHRRSSETPPVFWEGFQQSIWLILFLSDQRSIRIFILWRDTADLGWFAQYHITSKCQGGKLVPLSPNTHSFIQQTRPRTTP